MSAIVRRATGDDVERIYALGTADRVFEVSPAIHFYEKSELEEWVGSPGENVLLVAEESGETVGFLYAKVMSHHWAMLDTFYVAPAWRGRGIAKQMLSFLSEALRQRGLEYISTLCDSSDAELLRHLPRQGFTPRKTYVWHEMFLHHVRQQSAPTAK